MNRSKKYVIPNGPLITKLRQEKGWNREDLVEQSELVVEEIATIEDKNGTIGIWYRKRIKRDWSYGLTIARVARLENSKPVLPIALQILARTLGVTEKELIKPPADEPPPSPGSIQPGYECTNEQNYLQSQYRLMDMDQREMPPQEILGQQLLQAARELITIGRDLIRKLPPT